MKVYTVTIPKKQAEHQGMWFPHRTGFEEVDLDARSR